ncbi:MAG: mechanosensitive ion channel [Clostridia bacterium]|jgi:small conductance mechanosensitive channel|nr:mechanosensitive ion channel [Clostridia bacterium]
MLYSLLTGANEENLTGFAKFWAQVKDVLWNFANGYGKTIALAVMLFIVGLLVVSVIKKSVKKTTIKSRKIDNSASAFVTSIVGLISYVFLMLIVIASLGFSTDSIVTAFSSVMLAVALGLQNTLASLANGILLIFAKPFKAGDFVEVAGVSGTVKEIKLFTVKLVTPDNLTIVVPNNTVFGSTITNYSQNPKRRLDIVVPVAYGTNVEQVKSLLLGMVKEDKRVAKDPAPFCRLTEWADSSLNFTLRIWVNSGDFWNVKFDLLENILTALEENNIEIPYNKLDVQITKTDGEV